MPLEHQSVQACHAAVAAGRDLIRHPDPHLVLVTVPTINELVSLSVKLTDAAVAHRVFVEADMGGRATALATRPLLQQERKHLRQLPLFKARAGSSEKERVA